MQQSIVDRINQAIIEKPEHKGIKLGMIVAKTRVPLPVICEYLEISPNTLYRWFYGENTPTQSIASRVDTVIQTLEKEFEEGGLPAINTRFTHTDLIKLINKTND